MTREQIENSVAFSLEQVEELNDMAGSLDRRLFLFAYFEPKKLPPENNWQMGFYTAITNLYGLFWDCGSFVKNKLMTFRPQNCHQGILPREFHSTRCNLTSAGNEIRSRFYAFIKHISSVRAVFCHNCSEELYLSKQNIDIQNQRFESILSFDMNSSVICEQDWEKLLISLIEDANAVVNDLVTCLDWLKKLKINNPTTFKQIIDDWLCNGIGNWYIISKELIINVLADFYFYYLSGNIEYASSIREYNRYFSYRNNLQKWLVTNFGESAKSGEKWLRSSSINALLTDANLCPRPALPIELLSVLTQDVLTFARINRIR